MQIELKGGSHDGVQEIEDSYTFGTIPDKVKVRLMDYSRPKDHSRGGQNYKLADRQSTPPLYLAVAKEAECKSCQAVSDSTVNTPAFKIVEMSRSSDCFINDRNEKVAYVTKWQAPEI